MEEFERDLFVARQPRTPLALAASILMFPNRSVGVQLRNVGADGFSAACAQTVPIGAQIVLQLPEAGQFIAEVRWALGGNFGARFNGRESAATKEAIAVLADQWSAEQVPLHRAIA